MTCLGQRVGLGRQVRLSDVALSGPAARETFSWAGHYNIQHKALNDTVVHYTPVLWKVAAYHSYTDN